MNIKKLLVFWVIGSVVSLYTTFVIQNLWNWFATSALHVSGISFWGMYGLVLLVGLFTDTYSKDFIEEWRWKFMSTVLEACVPDHKKEAIEEQQKQQMEGIWMDAGLHVFGRLAANTFVFGLGFAVHAFLA